MSTKVALTQSGSYSALIPSSSILVVLFCRGDGKFHWAIGLAIEGLAYTFRKLHATQLNGPGWEYEDTIHDIARLQLSKPVCVIIQIGRISPNISSDHIAQTLGRITMAIVEREVKETTFTCRVWLLEAVRVLVDMGAISCTDIEGLEKECILLGEENDAITIMDRVHISQYCIA